MTTTTWREKRKKKEEAEEEEKRKKKTGARRVKQTNGQTETPPHLSFGRDKGTEVMQEAGVWVGGGGRGLTVNAS